MNNQLASITIHNSQVILHLADHRDVSLSIEDMFHIQGWIHENNLHLLELLYQPKEKMFNATQAQAAIQVGDTVSVVGKGGSAFAGLQFKVLDIEQKKNSERVFYLLDVQFQGVPRPSWFEAFEVEKIEQEGREQVL